jgi:acyl-CoA thioesterase FadM
MVCVDLAERKACVVPDDYRARVLAFEGVDVEQ